MKLLSLISITAALFIGAAGCSSSNKYDEGNIASSTLEGIGDLGKGALERVNGLVINKHLAIYEIGNLHINVTTPPGINIKYADMYIDDLYIGNLPDNKTTFVLKRGPHSIKILAPGCKLYQTDLILLGNPNSQVLNIKLEKENNK